MPLAKCPRCDKLFDKSTTMVCPDCVGAEEADHSVVRDVLSDDPNLNADQLAEKTGVGIDVVLRMIDSGSVSVADRSTSVLCGRCGAPAISASKKLCEKCLRELDREMSKSRQSIKLGEKRDIQIGQASVHETIRSKRRT